MAVGKKVNYDVQGGVRNYLGKQKEVKAPLKWQSSPDNPATELAYITKAEKDLLVKSDLHGSLKGDVNRGPSGIMSLDGYGSFDGPSGKDTGMSGAATSAAETGRNTSDTMAEGASYKDVQDYQSGAVAAGAGQRVNPGFFDSRNTVSPDVLARAKAFAPEAFSKSRSRGIMDYITGGGLIGMGIRGLGRKLGFGKNYNEPTYDMSNDVNYNYDGDFEDDDEGTIYGDDVLTKTTVAPPDGNGNGNGNVNNQGINVVLPQIEKLINENNGIFKSRFLDNRTTEEREAIQKMINEKFKYNYGDFGLGDMDGS